MHTPGSATFFGGNPQPLAETLTPKIVPAPCVSRENNVVPVNGYLVQSLPDG